MNNNEFEKYQEDIMSKMWHHDIFSLTNREIHKLIENLMYQIFLVQVTNVSVETKIDELGGGVNIHIEGIPYMDEQNLSESDYDVEDEDYDEEYEEE